MNVADPIMFQQLSLTLFFTNYKPNKTIQSFLVETATCEFTISALYHYSCFASLTLPYFIDFIKRALEFSKVRIKLLEMTFKDRKSTRLNSSHALTSRMPSSA